jgi:hypothetical protein
MDRISNNKLNDRSVHEISKFTKNPLGITFYYQENYNIEQALGAKVPDINFYCSCIVHSVMCLSCNLVKSQVHSQPLF